MPKPTPIILLMTATIEPNVAMPGTTRADPDLRRLDYMEALEAYLQMPAGVPDRILFCENSGADLSSLKALVGSANPHGKLVDFLSFRSDCPQDRGKGYSELDILDRAHEGFLLSGDEVENARIWKVTGRLVVSNLEEMIATSPEHFHLYADFRSVPFIGERLGGNDWVDTRLFAYTRAGYDRFIYRKKEFVGWTIEKSLFEMLRNRPEMGSDIVPRFRKQPLIAGVCGGSGANYSDNSKQIKQIIRGVARRAAPFIWL